MPNNSPTQSTASRFLSLDDLIILTGKKAASAQRRALSLMHIPFMLRPDGRPVVVVDAIRPEGTTFTGYNKPAIEPNWEAL